MRASYYVIANTTIRKGDALEAYGWSGQVDESGAITQFGAVSTITGGTMMPTTGGAPDMGLTLALLVASLLSIVGAGAIIRWRARVRVAEETYMLN